MACHCGGLDASGDHWPPWHSYMHVSCLYLVSGDGKRLAGGVLVLVLHLRIAIAVAVVRDPGIAPVSSSQLTCFDRTCSVTLEDDVVVVQCGVGGRGMPGEGCGREMCCLVMMVVCL